MTTDGLFREDGYFKECETVAAAAGDRGELVRERAVGIVPVVDTCRDRESGELLHVPAAGRCPAAWTTRGRRR